MNASNLEMKLSFKNKIISDVSKFNRKHKALSFLGMLYAIIAISVYNILFYFYRNSKRFICLASILLFFVSSSSFSYPAMSTTISFASGNNGATQERAEAQAAVLALSDEAVAESNARLITAKQVDEVVLKEAGVSVNPDAAEVDNMVSASEILDVDDTAISHEISTEKASAKVEGFNSDDWKIILVNKQHPIPDDYNFSLGTISGSMKCDERIITPLRDMLMAARADGVNLIVCSPYRSIDRQTMLFSNKITRYMGGGMSYMDAYNLASQAVTVPGSSEHQIGLAVDIITDGYSTLDEGFSETAAGKWLAANSYKYGFILRYPKGKEEITSIEFEPWHFRYVGVDAATVITDNNLCLEEFWKIYVD